MRISTEQGDPGFLEDAYLLDVTILFDGEPVNMCVTADSDKGEIVRLHIPLDGKEPVDFTYADPATGTFARYVYRGKVEIVENTL